MKEEKKPNDKPQEWFESSFFFFNTAQNLIPHGELLYQVTQSCLCVIVKAH